MNGQLNALTQSGSEGASELIWDIYATSSVIFAGGMTHGFSFVYQKVFFPFNTNLATRKKTHCEVYLTF